MSNILRRFAVRPSSPLLSAPRQSPIIRSELRQHPICKHLLITVAPFRATYASTTKGDAQNATSMETPSPKSSDSQAEGDIKSSRSLDGRNQESGSSVAKPVDQDQRSEAPGDEEGGAPEKKDPNKPAEQKRAEIEKDGMKPLDPADK